MLEDVVVEAEDGAGSLVANTKPSVVAGSNTRADPTVGEKNIYFFGKMKNFGSKLFSVLTFLLIERPGLSLPTLRTTGPDLMSTTEQTS